MRFFAGLARAFDPIRAPASRSGQRWPRPRQSNAPHCPPEQANLAFAVPIQTSSRFLQTDEAPTVSSRIARMCDRDRSVARSGRPDRAGANAGESRDLRAVVQSAFLVREALESRPEGLAGGGEGPCGTNRRGSEQRISRWRCWLRGPPSRGRRSRSFRRRRPGRWAQASRPRRLRRRRPCRSRWPLAR